MDAKQANRPGAPLGKRELDSLLAGRVNRRDRRYLYRVLDEVGLCIVAR